MNNNRNKEARSIANQLGYANKNIKLIAGGASGGIYNINGTGKVLKVMKVPKIQKVLNTQEVVMIPNTKQRTNEMNFQRRMARELLAPLVLSKFTLGSTKTYGGFLMKKLPPDTTTLKNYIGLIDSYSSRDTSSGSHYTNTVSYRIKLREETEKLVISAVRKMHRKGIHHGDLHDSNIMITYDPDTLEIKNVWIIDYGTATYIPIGHRFTNLAQPYIYNYNDGYILYHIPNPNNILSVPNHNSKILAGLNRGPRNPFIKPKPLSKSP
jgi:hypothetical protein